MLWIHVYTVYKIFLNSTLVNNAILKLKDKCEVPGYHKFTVETLKLTDHDHFQRSPVLKSVATIAFMSYLLKTSLKIVHQQMNKICEEQLRRTQLGLKNALVFYSVTLPEYFRQVFKLLLLAIKKG